MEKPEWHEKPLFDTEIPGNIHSRSVRPHIEMDKRRKSLGWYAGTLLALLATIAVASGLVWVIAMIWQAIL